MNELFSIFLCWQFGLLAISISLIVSIIRTICETYFIKLLQIKLWDKVFLPIFPIIVGIIIALITKYTFPSELTSLSSRIFFAMVAGSFSSVIYKFFVKGIMSLAAKAIPEELNKLDVKVTNSSDDKVSHE